MPSFGAFGRSIGDFGNQVGQGSDIAQAYRARQQQMAIEAARQKIASLMAPLQLQELQQLLRQMQQPQPAGIERGPNNALSGATWNPTTGKYELQPLAPGQAPTPKITTPFEAWRSENPNGTIEDWFKASQKPSKEPTDLFQVWRQQNPNASVSDWLKLQEKYKKTQGENAEKTPFELWKAQNPKGTYEQWIQQSKQVDRTDATKAATAAMNAFRNYQQIQSDALKNASHFNWLGKGKYSTDEAQQRVDAAKKDLDDKRQDAIDKLTAAGMEIPAWLRDQGGSGSATPTIPPPPGFQVNK